MDEREDKVESYCNQHREMTVMDAVKNVLSLDKGEPGSAQGRFREYLKEISVNVITHPTVSFRRFENRSPVQG
jgi:hypothetical protein